MVSKIRWTTESLNDLLNIYEFIAKDSSRYAQIQIENIQNAVLPLLTFPLMGHIVHEFPHLTYREILSGNYRIIYKYDESGNEIIVMFVAHGRQLLKEPKE